MAFLEALGAQAATTALNFGLSKVFGGGGGSSRAFGPSLSFNSGGFSFGLDAGTTNRSKGMDKNRTGSLYRGEMDFEIAGRVDAVAEKYGKTSAQISLAWLCQKPGVTAPIIGVSRLEQLEQLLEAPSIELTEEDVNYLEELYRPLENLLSLGM